MLLLERSYEPEVGLYLNFAFGTVSSQEDINDFIALKEVIALKDILILIPPGSGNGGGGDGFSGYNPAVINGHITQNPSMIALIKKFSLWNAIKLAFGFGDVFAVVVFNNGDVAKFQIRDFRAGGACCTYENNSARDINGDIIGGTGGGGSGDYVQPVGGSTNTITIRVNQIRFKCWKIPTGVMCQRLTSGT